MNKLRDDLKLHSVSASAKMLKISQDSLKKLIDQGRIGTLNLGKRRKIPEPEIIKFLEENTIREIKVETTHEANNVDIERFFYNNRNLPLKRPNGVDIFNNLMKKEAIEWQ
jgi:excisionase family DNA binding protein